MNNATQTPISGTTTDVNGVFKIETTARDFYIEIIFIGFVNQVVKEWEIKDNKIDIGDCHISRRCASTR